MFQGFPGLGERDLVPHVRGSSVLPQLGAVGEGCQAALSGPLEDPLSSSTLSSPHPCPRAEGSLNSRAGRGQRGRLLRPVLPHPQQDAQPETTGS